MKSKKDDITSSQLSVEEKQLIDFFANLRRNSLDTLEAAARQLIGLVTTLLGLFFGVLAFKDKPTYLASMDIKIMGMLAAVGYFIALFASLAVVLPRALNVPRYNLTAMRELLGNIFNYKSKYLAIAQISFGAGTFALLLLILTLLNRL